MAINVSGGIATARKKQKQIQQQKRWTERNKKKINKAQDVNKSSSAPEEFFEDPDDSPAMAEYHQTKLGRLLEIIESPIIILIILNAIQMGLGTFNFVTQNPEVEDAFELVDKIFLIIFTVEVSLNFLHYIRFDRIVITNGRLSFPALSPDEDAERLEIRPWLIFDASVVILSWAFASLSIVRAFRILRVLRLISKVESMKNVVNALITVMPKMGLVAFLLSLMLLVFGIAFTMLFSDLYEEGYTQYDYFSRIDITFLTLFQIMTFDSWHGVARSVMAVYPWSWILFIMWTILTGFIVVNLIIAIICESLVTMTEDEKAKKELEQTALVKLESQGEGVTEEGGRRSAMQTQQSTKSTMSTGTMKSEDYIYKYESVVDEILKDQEALIETVETLKDILKEVLARPPSKSRIHEIRSIFRY
jgi:uncharacterized membrane protein (DUF373 family)